MINYKNLIILSILVFSNSNSFFVKQQNSEIEDIYIAALNSLITEEQKKYLSQYEFIGLDFKTNSEEILSLNNKKNIMDHFEKKYGMNVSEVSIDEIERSRKYTEGLILKIDRLDFSNSDSIEFDSILYMSPIGIESYSNKMKIENGEWVVYDKTLNWMA